jgi:hypothetical protein
MSILREIQSGLLSDSGNLGTTLLKLRFLASRLGSEPLEDWVKYESEGYPREVDVPTYRKVGVSYTGNWSGPWGSGMRNAPIPPYLIEKHAGARWNHHEVRESIGTIETMAAKDEGSLGINASNLILMLQGKVYEDMACNSISGEISLFAVKEIVQTVRNRILELTIELEKRVPDAVSVTLEQPIAQKVGNEAAVTQIFNQTVYGNVTHVTATDNASVTLAITQGDVNSMVSELVKAGLPQSDAQEFAAIVASEKPESAEKPLGKKALAWMGNAAKKAGSGVWHIGSAVATTLLTEAALKYYGLK